MAVKAFVEIFSGIIRVGPDCDSFGKPYDFAVAFVANGGVAEVKGLVSENHNLKPAHAKAIIKALRELGLVVKWHRVDPKTGHMKIGLKGKT